MKRLEASCIKMILRISSWLLPSSSLDLSHYSLSLSYSWTLRAFLEHLALEQERQRRQEEAKIKHGKVGSSSYNRLHCRYQLACVFSLLYLACMGLHVFLFHHGMDFPRCDSNFSLLLPFPNSLDEMGSLMQFMWNGQIVFEAEWGGSMN